MGSVDGGLPMIGRFVLLLLVAVSLGGCMQTFNTTSIAGGESKVFEPPPYVVKGKAPYDQRWIDSQVEGGVAAFGWPRPKPRPPEIDAPRAKKKAVAPPKKRTIVQRIKDRVVHPFTKPVAPVIESPLAPPVVVTAPVQPPPAPPPKPRDPVDELLQPSKDQRRFN